MKRMIGIMVLALGVIGCDDSVTGPSVEPAPFTGGLNFAPDSFESTPCELVHVERRLLSAASESTVHVARPAAAPDALCGGAEVRLITPFE